MSQAQPNPNRGPRVSLSLAGLREPVRDSLGRASLEGVRAIQLDATHPDTRPRHLDRSARRDLASTLRRAELGFSGIDLWIPETHLVDAQQIERALDATRAAIELAADMAGLLDAPGSRVLSMTLPEQIPAEALSVIEAAAETHGVRVADHAYPDPLLTGVIGFGLDPAGVLVTGADPATVAFTHAETLLSARLSDMTNAGRGVPGSAGGRLDLATYAAALITADRLRHVVLDVRGLPKPWRAIASTSIAWTAATAMA